MVNPFKILNFYSIVITSLMLNIDAHGQVGGSAGYDSSLRAIEPKNITFNAGLAGSSSPQIGRLIVAKSQGVSLTSISPDGEYIAYVSTVTGKQQIWLQSVSGGQSKQLTFGNGVTGYFYWAPNGHQILYSSDNNGNEQESYFLLDVDAFSEREVLPAVAGGFRVFGGFVNQHTIIYASTERNKLDFDLYTTDLLSGSTNMVFEGRMGLSIRSVSPDGKWALMIERVGADSDNLYLFDISKKKLTTLSKPKRRANHSSGGFAWTRDSKGFYFSTNLGQEYRNLAFYDLKLGKRWVSKSNNEMEEVALCNNDEYLIWTNNVDGYSNIQIKSLNDKAAVFAPEFPKGVKRLDCSTNGEKIVITTNGWNDPGSIYSWNFSSKIKPVFKASLAGVSESLLVAPKSIRMKARDGVILQGLLYLPHDTLSAPPAVFSVHGGPTEQSRPYFDPMTQYLVNQGIAVFKPNVRGSTGFGHTYVTLDDRKKRLHSIRDLIDMHTYLAKEGFIDPDNVAIKGGSYGGYAVNAALANFPGYFTAGVSRFGVADWVNALQVASPSLKAADVIEYGDISDTDWLAYYQQYSPIRQAENINVPVLYSHGVMDPRVDISETEIMVKTLRKNGIKAPFIRMLNEGHGWRKLENQMFYAQQEAAFLKQVLHLNSAQ
ncbi:prolyl oligopeptidase family serine peptidase [Colwellia sp. RSH04]|uniref:S9 family peptidase n=1 Tax=Colwellia sp. RSH04 TaxID=2305464 RepID=UPI000E5978B6|nr:prolyl oligopeptidase family serine peptidase [Colwellia sp. RSH04]RHW74627.1 S9 family peptidase [Colwellia sp. RSH04]